MFVGMIHEFFQAEENHMRTTLKHFVVVLAVVLAGGMRLSAQHRGDDRLHRILDPLGILPSPRQVLRTLDHAARILPPVVVDTRSYPVYDADYEYRSYPVQDRCEPAPVRQYYAEAEPYPIRYYGSRYRYERFERRNHHSAPYRAYDHDRPRFRARR
jgi:hypothetical protein